MSYYYNYYIGYKKNEKIYPWGLYNANGQLKPVISKSRSFASDLHEDFYTIKPQNISDELRKEFEYKDLNGKNTINVKYLPVDELPNSDFIRRGYFLIKDIKEYQNTNSSFDLFYDYLTPEVYAVKLQHEVIFGKNQPQKDCEGTEYTEPNASDYMYYTYPDYNSKEYEVFMLKEMVGILRDYKMSEEVEYVILETEG